MFLDIYQGARIGLCAIECNNHYFAIDGCILESFNESIIFEVHRRTFAFCEEQYI